DIAVFHGVLNLMTRPQVRRPHMPIDYFLRSLAEDRHDRAVGIILSGTGSDGAMGLRAIKAAGGIAIAQDESSAAYEGMPRSAIAAGHVDFVLPPKEIAGELVRISRHPAVARRARRAPVPEPEEAAAEPLQKIFILLRNETGVDFTHYKQSTVQRRITRRMVLHKVKKLEHYVRYLQQTPAELHALYEDMLINVTGFFREPEAFEALKKTVFPSIADERASDTPIRIWVPGCSTGEEVYSIAICLLEYLGEQRSGLRIQIFATDISDVAIETARAGAYPANIAADVSARRLRRFFSQTDSGYQINKSVRDICIFARQNVTKDPPFGKIDLVSCRNLLIYLGPVLQNRTIPILHYALNPTGFLLLGASETIGRFSDLFTLADRKSKIYRKKAVVSRLPVDLGPPHLIPRAEAPGPQPARRAAWGPIELQKEADRIVLEKFGPSGVVIDSQMEIIQFRGHTGHYLEPAPGEAALNLMRMARPGMLLDLRAAIHEARQQKAPVRREGLRIQHNGGLLLVNFDVIPIGPPQAKGNHLLILFEEAASSAPAAEAAGAAGARAAGGKKAAAAKPARGRKRAATEQEARRLEEELAATKRMFQATIEEHEATTEELRAANEEIQSSNEELQSTNEELETAKEELQSANEELTTLNDELENRNLELARAADDLNNLLNSVNIPIVMLGTDLHIRSTTPLA
ncbi:MAG: CheR family methyltransferase, partial [Planctomycetota bacterium]